MTNTTPVTDAQTLVVYAIYHNPTDFPGEYVLRPWSIERPHTEPNPGALLARGRTLDYVRGFLPPGLCCLGRNASDDAAIVEVWI